MRYCCYFRVFLEVVAEDEVGVEVVAAASSREVAAAVASYHEEVAEAAATSAVVAAVSVAKAAAATITVVVAETMAATWPTISSEGVFLSEGATVVEKAMRDSAIFFSVHVRQRSFLTTVTTASHQ